MQRIRILMMSTISGHGNIEQLMFFKTDVRFENDLRLHSEKCHRLVASCQFYRLVATCQRVVTNLSISSSYNNKIKLVTTCRLQTCYNLLKQFNLQQACG